MPLIKNTFLQEKFFLQPTINVAINLLGKELSLYSKRGIITEVESYRTEEPSSHSYKGVTPRNRPMFEEGGTIYVYSIHRCLCMNLSANKKGIGDAILIRGLWDYNKQVLYDGPGKLCKYLQVQKSHNFLNLENSNFYLKEVNQQKLVKIPYDINTKRKQFLGNLVLHSLNNNTQENVSSVATTPTVNSNKIKLNPKDNFLNAKNKELYYYATPRIGLNPKNSDYHSLERFVLAEFSTKRIKLS